MHNTGAMYRIPFSCQQHHQSSFSHLITIFGMIKLKQWYMSIDEKVSTLPKGAWLVLVALLKSFVKAQNLGQQLLHTCKQFQRHVTIHD